MTDEVAEVKKTLMNILHGIQQRNNDTYRALVHKDLTCFEPESLGYPIDGLDFHLFFAEVYPPPEKYRIELVRPTIRVFGDTAYASYTLLVQIQQGKEVTITSANETRIFHKNNGIWQMVHFHRSKAN